MSKCILTGSQTGSQIIKGSNESSVRAVKNIQNNLHLNSNLICDLPWISCCIIIHALVFLTTLFSIKKKALISCPQLSEIICSSNII